MSCTNIALKHLMVKLTLLPKNMMSWFLSKSNTAQHWPMPCTASLCANNIALGVRPCFLSRITGLTGGVPYNLMVSLWTIMGPYTTYHVFLNHLCACHDMKTPIMPRCALYHPVQDESYTHRHAPHRARTVLCLRHDGDGALGNTGVRHGLIVRCITTPRIPSMWIDSPFMVCPVHFLPVWFVDVAKIRHNHTPPQTWHP